VKVFKLLDLCCGFGFWSIGFYREGFDCTGVDIVDVGYPYKLVLEDIRNYHPKESYDVIVASPPCTEFSSLLFLGMVKGQRGPGNPEKGMELVRECHRVIEEAKPIFWALENVRGAVKHIEPLLGKPKLIHKPWYIWGCFPNFLLSQSNLGLKVRTEPDGKISRDVHFDPLISWKRSRIPLPLSEALAKACKRELQKCCL